MKEYNVVLRYSVRVEAEDEDTAKSTAWSLFGEANPRIVDNFSCTVEEVDPYILDGKIDPDQEPQPIGMQCPIIWDNEEGRQDVYISFMSVKNQEHAELTGLDEYGVSDDLIFYHMDPEEVKNLWLAIAGSREQFSVGAGWAIDLSEHWAMAYEL